MLNFVKKAFKVYLEILLWVILIAFIVVGTMIGSSSSDSAGYAILGLFLGGIVGLIVCFSGGGVIVTLLKSEM